MYFIDHAGGAVYSYDFAATPVRISSVTAYGGTFTGLGYGGRPFFTDVQTGYLYWLPAANSPSVFGTGFAGKASPPAIGPQGIAFDGQNVLFVGDGDRIWRIVGPMPTVNLSANSNRRTVGEAVALTWSSSGATSCGASGGAAADGWAGSKALAGSATLTESTPGTYTYVLLCTSAAGSTSAQTSVTFTLPSATLVANPAALTAGDMATLTWTSVDSTSCDATGGAPNDGWAGRKAANGSVSLTSATAGTYVYTIACTAGSQSSQAQVSITYTVPSVSL
jgi:plastocyanin